MILPDHSCAVCADVILSGMACGLVVDTPPLWLTITGPGTMTEDGKRTLVARLGTRRDREAVSMAGVPNPADIQPPVCRERTEFSGQAWHWSSTLWDFSMENQCAYDKDKAGKRLNIILAQTAPQYAYSWVLNRLAILIQSPTFHHQRLSSPYHCLSPPITSYHRLSPPIMPQIPTEIMTSWER